MNFFEIKQLAKLAERLLDKNCLFVIDEAYYLFGSETAIPLVKEYPNVVILRTFSKGFGLPAQFWCLYKMGSRLT